MSVPVLHEGDVEELDLPGRRFRWLVADGRIPSDHCSACVIRVAPGDRVRPAHSHPHSEEVIYILSGSGRVLVEGEVAAVRAGSTVLFPQGAVHMLAQHQRRRDEGGVFFCAGHDAGQLQDSRRRGLSRVAAPGFAVEGLRIAVRKERLCPRRLSSRSCRGERVTVGHLRGYPRFHSRLCLPGIVADRLAHAGARELARGKRRDYRQAGNRGRRLAGAGQGLPGREVLHRVPLRGRL